MRKALVLIALMALMGCSGSDHQVVLSFTEVGDACNFTGLYYQYGDSLFLAKDCTGIAKADAILELLGAPVDIQIER